MVASYVVECSLIVFCVDPVQVTCTELNSLLSHYFYTDSGHQNDKNKMTLLGVTQPIFNSDDTLVDAMGRSHVIKPQ